MPPLLPTLTGLTAPCSGSSLALSCGGANRQLDGYAGSTIFCLHQAERNAMPLLIPDIFTGPLEYLQAEEILRRLFDRIKCEDRSEEHTSELKSLMRISYAACVLQ